mmetsp:Transcript_11963/g.37229  ORF Transcript_11963/g.37229 Transcript_11963/m.37229 type:complete len:219 (+) Transcript_11963:644-1300(+)
MTGASTKAARRTRSVRPTRRGVSTWAWTPPAPPARMMTTSPQLTPTVSRRPSTRCCCRRKRSGCAASRRTPLPAAPPSLRRRRWPSWTMLRPLRRRAPCSSHLGTRAASPQCRRQCRYRRLCRRRCLSGSRRNRPVRTFLRNRYSRRRLLRRSRRSKPRRPRRCDEHRRCSKQQPCRHLRPSLERTCRCRPSPRCMRALRNRPTRRYEANKRSRLMPL